VRCRPANFFEVNPGITLPPNPNKASVEVDGSGGGKCCGGGGGVTRDEEIRETQDQVSRNNCCSSGACRCAAGCTCMACGCRRRAMRLMQPKL